MHRGDKDMNGHSEGEAVGFEQHLEKSSNQQRVQSKTYPVDNMANLNIWCRGMDLEQGIDGT